MKIDCCSSFLCCFRISAITLSSPIRFRGFFFPFGPCIRSLFLFEGFGMTFVRISRSHFDTLGLSGDVIDHLQGIGGLTVARLRLDLGIVSCLSRQVVILELGTNDLARLHSEVAGSKIEELVRLLLDTFSVRVIGVCEVLPRVKAPFFNGAASILNQYLCGVLEPIPNVFVGVIEVLTTLRFTLICPMGFV